MSKEKHRIRLFIDRTLSQSFGKQVLVLLGVVVGFLGLSYILLSFSGCDWCRFCKRNDLKAWLLPIYLLIDTNALNNLYMKGHVHGWMLAASSITYLLGVVIFNGVLIGVITNYINHRVQDYREGLRHYLKKGHHIIMGYDDMVPSIIMDIFEKDKEKNRDTNILILTSYDVPKVKEKLQKSVAKDKLDKIIVNYGQKTASEYYKDIHLEKAEDIFVIGNRQQPAHDAVNVECVDNIYSYLEKIKSENKPKRIVCLFEDIDTFAALKTSEIFSKLKKLNMEFIPYNFYTGWTNQVFVKRQYREKNENAPQGYPAIYKDGIKPDDKKRVHMVIVGSNNFASTIATEAAHLHHFPNFDKDNSQKTRITFIDHNADHQMPLFFTRCRHFCEVQSYLYCNMTADNAKYSPEIHKELLSKEIDRHDFLDVEFEFIKGDVFSKQVQDLLSDWAVDEHQYLSIFLAMTDQRNNFVMGMNMPDEVYENKTPIFIRQERADNFVTNLRNTDDCFSPENLKKVKDKTTRDSLIPIYKTLENGVVVSKQSNGRYANIYPFGMEDMAYCFDEDSLKRAKLVNYIYSFLYDVLDDLLQNNTTNKDVLKEKLITEVEDRKALSLDTIWSEANEKWKKLSVSKKWSNFYCADNIQCKLDTLQAIKGKKISKDDILTEEEMKMIAVMEHNRWNVEKLFMGFRVAKPNEDFYKIKNIEDKTLKEGEECKDTNKDLFIHSDIRPYNELNIKSTLLNEITAYCLPWILGMTEESNNTK